MISVELWAAMEGAMLRGLGFDNPANASSPDGSDACPALSLSRSP